MLIAGSRAGVRAADVRQPVADRGQRDLAAGERRGRPGRVQGSRIREQGQGGPALVVIPGEVKSNNATFTQRFLPNNIADFGELELSQANFPVLERSNLGQLLQRDLARLQPGRRRTRRARRCRSASSRRPSGSSSSTSSRPSRSPQNKQGFDGRAIGGIIGMLGGSRGARGRRASPRARCRRRTSTGVWLIGMRYKIMDANTTEQVAQGYKELKMEVGATPTSVLGVSQRRQGRRRARHDGAAPGADRGLGDRLEVQVTAVATPSRHGRRHHEARQVHRSAASSGKGAMGVVYEGFDPVHRAHRRDQDDPPAAARRRRGRGGPGALQARSPGRRRA